MGAFQQRSRISRQFRAALFLVVAGVTCVFGLGACSDATGSPTAATSATAELPTTASSQGVANIELTDKGFSPDRTEVSQGTKVTLRNATDSRQSVVVKGRDLGGSDGDRLTLEPGQSLDLNIQQLGAYVLTLADDPQVTASVFIS